MNWLQVPSSKFSLNYTDTLLLLIDQASTFCSCRDSVKQTIKDTAASASSTIGEAVSAIGNPICQNVTIY